MGPVSRRVKVGLACASAAGIAAATLAVVLTTPAASVTPTGTDAGTLTCTTNAQSYCTAQPHQLGAVPVAILATAQAPIAGNNIAANLDADQFTATTFRIRAFQPNGSSYANRVLTYSYAAYAGPPPVATTTAEPPPTTTTPAPTTTEPPPPTTEPPTSTTWPAPGTVGLKITTTRTWSGGRLADPGDYTAAGWTGTGTQADPYVLDRTLVTGGLRLGCACGSNALTNVWAQIQDSWVQGDVGNPTPDNSRFIQVENDGPHLTILRSNLQPAGTLNAAGIRTDNACSDKGLLSYRPFTLVDSRVSGANVPVAMETERNEGATLVEHNDLRGICSNSGDHTDVYNANGHGSHVTVRNNYIDGTRSGGAVVNNALGIYNDNIGSCDTCATIEDFTITGNRIVHYNIGVLSDTNTSRVLSPWVVQDNTFDAPTALGDSPGSPYVARVPTVQSGNTVNGTPVTF